MGTSVSRLQRKPSSLLPVQEKECDIDRSTLTTSSQHSDPPTSLENSNYWLPKTYEEQDRLMGQHFAIKELFGGNVLQNAARVLPLDEGVMVLDEMATDYPNCEVYGIDIYPTYPQTIRPPNSVFMLADAIDGLPFADNSFDLVQVRLMVAAFKVEDWPRVIADCVRILKPGGVLQMIEPDYRDSGGGACQLLVRTLIQVCEQRGQNPRIGSCLETLMRRAGLLILDRMARELDHAHGGKLVAEWTYDWRSIAATSRPLFEQTIGLSGDKYTAFLKDIEPSMKQYHFKSFGYAVTGRKPMVL
ncbi:S-adenosyl-L-methionine-dependent methyltransferase [Hesseltinella vesiculosa]|uniref:S-adenosyl-L-methionine-dependent methyltransferase n=1 Tax=Hesseltinella vesiculosa TaxID=101127 RepID=A0A1X2G615_9FUNG|nr:S-adenosyl-L-methionine-dependent methyltransferase [Hesseltinella vesiculosa]